LLEIAASLRKFLGGAMFAVEHGDAACTCSSYGQTRMVKLDWRDCYYCEIDHITSC
jgi:hypothetical protein